MKTNKKTIRMPQVLVAAGAVLACFAVPALSSSYMLRVFNMALITYLWKNCRN